VKFVVCTTGAVPNCIMVAYLDYFYINVLLAEELAETNTEIREAINPQKDCQDL
jgi:hypothetical protein